jgi:signal transduction histidine kinase
MHAKQFKCNANVLDNLSANIVILDCNYIITHINTAALNFFNNSDTTFRDKFPHAKKSDLIGKSINDLYPNSAYQRELLDNLNDTIKFSFKLGSAIVEMIISQLNDEHGQKLGAMMEWENVTIEMSISHALGIAHKKAAFNKKEKGKRADELAIANTELKFQNSEKEKRASELLIANAELYWQNCEKEKRAVELAIANENIAVMNEEYIASNEELIYQNCEKEKRADELVIANKELAYQNLEKGKRADELELIITQNEVLNQQVNHLQKLESIGRMSAGIAHDFNNILACIIGYNEMNNDVRNDMKDEGLKAELASNTEQIANAGQRAMSLIEKMMTYSRQDTQSAKEISVEHTAIAISDVLEMLRPALTSRIQLEFIHGDEFIDIRGVDTNTDNYDSDIQIDVVALHQIVTNLAVNARDAMKEHGGLIKISLSKVIEKNTQCVACRALTDGQFIELSVSDKGTGIEPKVINRIFDPFFTTKPQGEGTGLGLSTLTGLVHSALGHIIVNSDMSESNHGTTFRLLFPIMKYGI